MMTRLRDQILKIHSVSGIMQMQMMQNCCLKWFQFQSLWKLMLTILKPWSPMEDI